MQNQPNVPHLSLLKLFHRSNMWNIGTTLSLYRKPLSNSTPIPGKFVRLKAQSEKRVVVDLNILKLGIFAEGLVL